MICSSLHKRLVLFMVLTYIVFTGVFVLGFAHVGKYILCELLITQHLLCFLSLYYFFPNITTRKKSIAYCILIPLLCCVVVYTTHDIVVHLVERKLPFYIKINDNIISVILGAIINFGLGPYLAGICLTTAPLLIVCCFNFYLLKPAKHFFEKKEAEPIYSLHQAPVKIRLFQHRKITLFTAIFYIIHSILHLYILKWQWDDYSTKTFFSAIPVSLLSFLSLLYLAPMVIGKAVKSIVCCIVLPFFWSTMIYIVYAIMIFVFLALAAVDNPVKAHYISIGNFNFILADSVYSVKFYLSNYIVTQAWFISISLLLICGIYYYLAKSELSRKVETKESESDCPEPPHPNHVPGRHHR